MARLLILLATLFGLLRAADLTLEVVKEVGNEPKIAIEDASEGIDPKLDEKFFKLITGDLIVTAHFDVDRTKYSASFDAEPDAAAHSDKSYLLRYRLRYDERGKLTADAKLFDLKKPSILLQKSYSISDSARYPFMAHRIVYDLSRALGHEDVEFLRSFVIFSKYTRPRHADIIISDYTLTYQKPVVTGGLNLFPKWASKEQRAFYYTSMDEREPTLYRVDIYSGERTRITSSPGMLVCSDVSEDGTKLLLTMAPNFQPDVYLYDLRTGGKRRITHYSGIDVNGNFTQHDKRVVFVSDRLGYPTIFMKTIGSRGVQRLIYHGRNNNSCTTYGDYVVYSSRETDNPFDKNTFNLYLASTKSDYIRRLTSNGVNIFPRFASDGETLLFIKEFEKQSGLGVIRLRYNKAYIYPLYTGKIQSIDW